MLVRQYYHLGEHAKKDGSYGPENALTYEHILEYGRKWLIAVQRQGEYDKKREFEDGEARSVVETRRWLTVVGFVESYRNRKDGSIASSEVSIVPESHHQELSDFLRTVVPGKGSAPRDDVFLPFEGKIHFSR